MSTSNISVATYVFQEDLSTLTKMMVNRALEVERADFHDNKGETNIPDSASET
jgi:hypothetical protein